MRRLLFFVSLTLSTASFCQVPNYVPTNGLIGWWPFNGNANDESGNGNHGTVNGATLTSDRFGNSNQAYNFDGVNDFIEVINTPSLNPTEISLNAWIQIDMNYTNGSLMIISNVDHSNANSFSYNLGLDQMVIGSFFSNSCSNTFSGSIFNHNFQNSTWYMLTSTVNSMGELKIFINGDFAFLYQGNNFITCNYPNSTLRFGQWWNADNQWFYGKLDDIGIWNRALSDCEIADLYHSQLGYLNSSSTQVETALDSYTWPINNQTYTQSGTYTAVIPNAAGCDSTINLNLTLDFTGIEENGANFLAVYPNPSTSFLTIEGDGIQNKEYTLLDNQGRVVLSGNCKSNKEIIDLKTITRGHYMLKVNGKEMMVVKE